MVNKEYEKGRKARREGKRRRSPYDPRDKWFPTESERRKDVDWLRGYDDEDKVLSDQVKKKK